MGEGEGVIICFKFQAAIKEANRQARSDKVRILKMKLSYGRTGVVVASICVCVCVSAKGVFADFKFD